MCSGLVLSTDPNERGVLDRSVASLDHLLAHVRVLRVVELVRHLPVVRRVLQARHFLAEDVDADLTRVGHDGQMHECSVGRHEPISIPFEVDGRNNLTCNTKRQTCGFFIFYTVLGRCIYRTRRWEGLAGQRAVAVFGTPASPAQFG